MENKSRFRNHISIIFENTIRTIGVIFFIFIGNFISGTEESPESEYDVLILIIILSAVLVILLTWQIIIWAKTYIYIQDNTLIVERNTLNRQKNTIGLKNISNVNLEQNLLEMIFGTCKVKLDTNSLSTAEQTDVKIVLKKKEAENFRQMILGRIEEKKVQEVVPISKSLEPQRKYVASTNEILIHGLFSIHFFSLLVLVGAIIGVRAVFSDLSLAELGENFAEIIFSIIFIVWIIGRYLWNIVKGFITYMNLNVERKQDKLFLSYGILKKVTYSVPVDKINAVRLIQTTISRIGKYYTVEIVNVGMDDDENETNSFLLPYAKKERIKALLHMLLPEFDGCLDIKEEKQPKCIWIIWIPTVLIYLILATIVCGLVHELIPELIVPTVIVLAVIILLIVCSKIASYLTRGLAVHEQFLKIVEGSYARSLLFVKYNKIQYIQAKQNIVAKKFKVQKGSIWLLASLKNRVHELPYFKEEKMEVLKKHLI